MKFNEFDFEIDRLRKIYGAAKYPPERTAVMFEKLSGLPLSALRDQVSFFIADMDKAPLLNHFISAFYGQMLELKKIEIDRKLEGINPCVICSDSGVEIFYERVTANSYAFQCSCKRGSLLNPTYPKQYFSILEKYASHREWVSGKYNKPMTKGKT